MSRPTSQRNRFYGWGRANEEQILENLRAAAPRISRYADWTLEMLELNQQGIRKLAPGIARKIFKRGAGSESIGLGAKSDLLGGGRRVAVVILVTGATGTVGAAVVRRLRERGQAVRAIVRDRSAPSPLPGLDVELFQADLRRPQTLEGAFGGVHIAFVLTPSVDDQAAMEIGFIDAAVSAGIGAIVKHSAVGADASASGLVNAHGRSERHLIGSGISYVIVRPTQFMQNLLSWTPGIARASALVIPLASPEVRINMVDVQDVADVEATVLSEDGHAGRIYTPSGPDLLTYGEVAERLSAGVGTAIPLQVPSADRYRDDMLAAGYPDAAVTGTIAYFSTLRQETTALGITTQDVEEVTGHRPRSVQDFALGHADSLRPA